MMAASRLQRWAIKISAYTFDIQYVNTKDNGADGLSRLPIPIRSEESLKIPEQTYLHFAETELLLDYIEIKKNTQRDPLLSRVLTYIRNSWPSESEIKSLTPYFNRKNELYDELGCVMWGHRVVIPEDCRRQVLLQLHECHMGITKTKTIARSYVWWPGIDEAIEGMCRLCTVCAAESDAPARHTPSVWPWPTKPWSRIHADFLGPIFGKIYLIVVDARTKWLEVFQVSNTSAAQTIMKLSELFSRWGLPKQIVSDNGPPFTSKEFGDFLKGNGIRHSFSAPYHPASNGAAENAVRTIKKVIKKAVRQKTNIDLALSLFLLHYRNTEHCTTGESPASLMLGRRLRTKLDVLRPDCENKVQEAQQRQANNQSGVKRGLVEGDPVWLRQYQGNTKWLPGVIQKRLGSTNYRVLDEIGNNSHRHIDQLKRRSRCSLACPPTKFDQDSLSKSPEKDNLPANIVTSPKSSLDDQDDEGSHSVNSSPDVSDATKAVESPTKTISANADTAVIPNSVPLQSRPIRKCREKTPRYKF